jgi:hypothetical protein
MWRLLAALVFFGLAIRAQDATGAIEGVLTDSAVKLPVMGAQLSITPEGTAADVFTDASGNLALRTSRPAATASAPSVKAIARLSDSSKCTAQDPPSRSC